MSFAALYRPPVLIALLVLLATAAAWAAPDYPALTGRVVDEAGVIKPQSRAQLDGLLAEHERATGNQVVVVTIRSLQGEAIEEYGVGLGREWGIGRKGEDDGVLLIVAPNERDVRIEIGYGLEGALTDALASQIIQNEILPRFRAGDLDGGIVAGTEAILRALGGDYQPEPWTAASGPAFQPAPPPVPDWVVPLLFFAVWALVVFLVRRRGGRRRGIWMGGPVIGGLGHGGRGGFSGGGFSGRGGGFGGGGATGRW